MNLTGFYRALVVNASDPEGLGRIQVQIPQLMGTATSGWANPVPLGADIPAVGSQVMVTFEGGDLGHPLYLGTSHGNAAADAATALSAAEAAQSSANTAQNTANTALQDAQSASALAGTKAVVLYSTVAPSGSCNPGDLWLQTAVTTGLQTLWVGTPNGWVDVPINPAALRQGAGSGLNADLFQGQSPSAFVETSSHVAIPYAVATGVANLPAFSGAGVQLQTVSLPTNRFTQPPVMFPNITTASGSASKLIARIDTITTTSARITLWNGDGTDIATAVPTPVQWTAIQMTSSSATG